MPQTYYDDGVITVTETEIKTVNHTLYLDKVSAVDVASLSLGKFIFIPIIFSLIPIGFLAIMFRGFMLRPLLVLFVPMALLALALSFFRNTRVMLHTVSGKVILAQKLGFGEQPEILAQYRKLKSAIEDAKAGRPPGSAPSAPAQRFTI